MAVDDTTRKINILQPLSTLVSILSKGNLDIQGQVSRYIDTRGRLVVTEDDEITYLGLYWDRIDEALSVEITKAPVGGKGFDETNTFDQKSHRIYPAFVAGAPTVAGQFQIQKLGYVETELPVGNSMTATFSSLSTIELEFTNTVIVASLDRTIRIEALPFGEILSLNTPTAGSGYLSTGSYFDETNQIGDYNLSNGSGSDATVTVVATPTVATSVSAPVIINPNQRYNDGWIYSATLVNSIYNARISAEPSGNTLQLMVVAPEGELQSATVHYSPYGFLVGDVVSINNGSAEFTIDGISGGEITSVELSSAGIDYVAGDVLTVTPDIIWYGIGFIVEEDSTVTVETAVTTNGEAATLSVIGVTADEPKSNTVTVSISPATYSTTYRVTAGRVLNLAKESSLVSAVATTEAATLPCPAITSILFEAYGSGSQSLAPRTLAQYNATHSNTQFLYYGTEGISWGLFITQSEFTGANPPIEVPESVTPPTTVYAYYRDGAYLLPDASWIVGIIGSETDYEGNYEYVLYTLDNILNYKQLTPGGSSTAPCGTSDWGGDWGASIQQFAIRR